MKLFLSLLLIFVTTILCADTVVGNPDTRKGIYTINEEGSDTHIYTNFRLAYNNSEKGQLFRPCKKKKSGVWVQIDFIPRKFKKYIGDKYELNGRVKIYEGNFNKSNRNEFKIIERYKKSVDEVKSIKIIRR